MLATSWLIVALTALLINESQCAKILVVYPSPSKSHLINGKPLFTELAQRGHNVTVISNFPLENPMENYRDITIPVPEQLQTFMKMSMGSSIIERFDSFNSLIKLQIHSTLTNPQVLQIMKEESFDLVIYGYVLNDALLGIGAHFNCPQIVLFANTYIPYLNSLVGNPEYYSYIPHFFYNNSKNRMNFIQRIKNTIFYILNKIMYIYLDYLNNGLYNDFFPPDKYPSLSEVKKNVSLVLINSHVSQGINRPNQPNIIEIGGMSIKKIPSPLPEDIKEWLDSATDGAIFMSFGSNLKSSELPEEKIKVILTVFGKIKEKVLLKWEDDQLPGKPDNVKIGKWLPQDDILAHQNIKLFITHGGLGSLTESKSHGVPVLGMAMFGDQPINVGMVVNEGWAVSVSYDNLTELSFSEGLNEVLTNPRYSNRVKEISNLYKDRPMPALETAVYWTEYVLRHNGAKHLQSDAVHLNFIQLNLLDVWGFILIIVLAGVTIQIVGLKFIYKKIVRKLDKKNKNN